VIVDVAVIVGVIGPLIMAVHMNGNTTLAVPENSRKPPV
jgi:hypothetical protein